MFKIFRYAIFSFVLLAVVACGNSKNSPEGVVDAFFTNIVNNKPNEAIELIDMGDSEMGSEKEKLNMMIGMMISEIQKSKEDFGDIKIGEVTYSEDKNEAEVKVLFTDKDGNSKTDNIPVIKRNDEWKIKLL